MSHTYPLNSLPPSGYVFPPGYNQASAYNPVQNYARSTENLLAAANLLPQTLVNLNNGNLTTTVNSTTTSSAGYNTSQLTEAVVRNILVNHLNNEDLNKVNCSEMSEMSEHAPSKNETAQTSSQISSVSQSPPSTSPAHDGSSEAEGILTEDVVIVNTVLSYMQSQLHRVDRNAVIELTAKHFTLEEIKDARKCLYFKTGCKKYTYKGVNNPSTTQQQVMHCIASIIAKMDQLKKMNTNITYSCSAEELFKVSNFMMVKDVSSDLSPDNTVEDRLKSLEKRMSSLENKGSSYANKIDFPPLNIQQANNSGSSGSRPNFFSDRVKQVRPATPGSLKRQRTEERASNNWIPVSKKNTRSHKPTFWGQVKADQSSNLCGVQLHDVFLFNYDPESTEEQVKEHFTNKGVRVHSVKQKSHPAADAKSFLMRIKNKEDFDVIINNVPYATAARWWERNRRYGGASNNQEIPYGESTPRGQVRKFQFGPREDHGNITPRSIVSQPMNCPSPNADQDAINAAGNPNLKKTGSRATGLSSITRLPQVPDLNTQQIPMPNSMDTTSDDQERDPDNQTTGPTFQIGGPVSFSRDSISSFTGELNDEPSQGKQNG